MTVTAQTIGGVLVDATIVAAILFAWMFLARKRGWLSLMSNGRYEFLRFMLCALAGPLAFAGQIATANATEVGRDTLPMDSIQVSDNRVVIDGQVHPVAIVYSGSATDPKLDRVTTKHTKVTSLLLNTNEAIEDVTYELTVPLGKEAKWAGNEN